MKSFAAVLLVLFVICSSAYGQGAYLDRGQSGVEIGGGYSTNKDGTGIGVNAGFAVNNIFDIGIGLENFSYTQKIFGAPMTALSFSPNVTCYVIKNNEKLPLSFAVTAGYGWQTNSSDALDYYNLKMTSESFSIGGSLFGNLKVSESFRIKPSFGFGYIIGEAKLEDEDGNKITKKDDTTVLLLGLGLAFDVPPQNIFVISPAVSISNGTTSFGVGLSLIIRNH